MSETFEGGCSCGAVRFKLTSRPMFTHCCHCLDCQKQTGGAFAINALMETARNVAGKITRHPPEAVRVEMEAYYRGRELSRADALAFTKHLYRVQRMGLREEPIQPDRFLYRQS